MSAPISPASSASPTPSIATRMIPTTPKLLKLATGDVTMNRMPSAREQALDGGRLGLDLHVLGRHVVGTGTCGTSTALPGG